MSSCDLIRRPALHSVIHTSGPSSDARSEANAILEDDVESWHTDDESSEDDGHWSVASDEPGEDEYYGDEEALCSDSDSEEEEEDDYVYVPRPTKRRRVASRASVDLPI